MISEVTLQFPLLTSLGGTSIFVQVPTVLNFRFFVTLVFRLFGPDGAGPILGLSLKFSQTISLIESYHALKPACLAQIFELYFSDGIAVCIV